MRLPELPYLGVGVSLSLEAPPEPAELARAPGGPQFVEYAGRVSLDHVKQVVDRVREAGAAVLFHPSFVNFCGTFPNSTAWLEEASRQVDAVGSAWFAQDVGYCFWGAEHGYSTQFGYFLPPILNAASVERAVERVQEVQARLKVPVAIEPPPLTFAVGSMPLLGFIGEIARRADSAILLDAGHLVAYEMATGRRVADELGLLDAERVIELHVAGGRLHRGKRTLYLDAHERPILDETWRMLDALLPKLPALRAVCFECEGTTRDEVMRVLARVRDRVMDSSASLELVKRARRVDHVA